MIHDDVRTLTAGLLRDGLGYLPSVIVGSPPCQDISIANAGGRGVDGERSGLFFEAVRIIGEIRPAWACLENSPVFRTRGADRVLAELEALDYACWPLVVGADHAGAPHLSRRAWLVAVDKARREGPEAGWPLPVRTGPEIPLPAGAGAHAGHHWSAEPDLAGGVADGLSRRVAGDIIAAYGDSVVPAITEAIGRTMMKLVPTDGTVLDLFAGAAGGWSLGMHRAGYNTVAFCEIDPWRRSVLERRWGMAA